MKRYLLVMWRWNLYLDHVDEEDVWGLLLGWSSFKWESLSIDKVALFWWRWFVASSHGLLLGHEDDPLMMSMPYCLQFFSFVV